MKYARLFLSSKYKECPITTRMKNVRTCLLSKNPPPRIARMACKSVFLGGIFFDLGGVQDSISRYPRPSPPPLALLKPPKISRFCIIFRCLFGSIFIRSCLDYLSQLASQNLRKSKKNQCQEVLHLGLRSFIDF